MTDLAIVLAASSAAGLQARRVMQMRRRARLRIKGPSRGTVPQRVRVGPRPAMLYSVFVQNAGPEVATACLAWLEKLERFDGALWQNHPGFTFPLPLTWSGLTAQARLDLEPDSDPWSLPVLLAWLDGPGIRLATPLQISSGLLLDYSPGRYRLTVAVGSSAGGSTAGGESVARRRFEVRYEGRPGEVEIREVME
jgi:hypothetical protein